MKKSIFTILMLLITMIGFSQTVLFQENFEGSTIGFTSTSVKGNNSWAITSNLKAQGLKADSAKVAVGDTTYLTSNSFSTLGMTFVQLNFSHIAKVEFFDAAIIEVSNDNGANWVKLTSVQYLGTGQFGNIGNKFASTSYTDWLPSNNNAVPTNAWFKHESFNISSLVSNVANAKVRFALIDANNTGAMGNYGWIVDSVLVTAAPSELLAPTISLISPYPQDTAYTAGPYTIKVTATDVNTGNSGLDTVYVAYHTSTGVYDTLGMTMIAPDTFSASIPFYGYGRSIIYKAFAFDASAAHNMASTPTKTFFCKFSPGGLFTIGTGTVQNTTTSYPTPFGQYFTGTRQQNLILASELTALGAAGGNITSLAFFVVTTNAATSTGANHKNWTIKLKNSSVTALTSTFETGLTQVYTVSSYQTVVGWNTFTFTTPFVWDGVSNIVVESCYDNYVSTSDYSLNAVVNATATSFTSVGYYYSDGGSVCSYGTATTSPNRPNMQLNMAMPQSITNDIGVFAITNPNGGVVANTPFDIKVKVKNFGIDTNYTGTIHWKFDGTTQTSMAIPNTLMPGVLSPEYTLGSKTVSSGTHTIKAWTENPDGISDFNFGNDSASYSFYTCASLLNGTYTIGGTNPDFATFADAFLALNQCGITGPVVFNVAPGTYNEQITVPLISGVSATNTITFQSANGDSTSVVIQYAGSAASNNFMLKFDDAKYITFKKMTFKTLGTSFASVVSFTNGSQFINLLNNVFIGVNTGLTNNDQSLVKSLATSADSAIIINNNFFSYGYNGLVMIGTSSTNLMNGFVANGNIFRNQVKYNAYFENINALEFGGNDIKDDSTIAAGEGIYLIHIKNQFKIYNNNVNIFFGPRALSIWNCNGTSGNEGLIYNNMFSLGGTSTHLVDMANGTYIKFLYNSFNKYANTTGEAFFINETSGTTNYLHFYNNNFINNATQGYAVFYNFALGSKSLFWNNNNYFTKTGGKIGKMGTDATTLTAWKALTNQDQNSVSLDPYFASHTNLHVSNNLLNATAQPIAIVTTDIDGDLRDATTPDIGADEFTPSPYDLTSIAILSPTSDCGLDTNETVILRIKNIGSASVNGGFTANYRANGSIPVSENVSLSLSPGDTLDYSFTTKVDLDVTNFGSDSTFAFKAWISLSTDPVHHNDTAYATIDSRYQPPVPIVNNTTANYGTSINITAISNDSLSWFATDTSSVALANQNVFTTPLLYDTTTFWVAAGGAGVSGSMQTTWVGGNGSAGNMFDITAINTITIDSFDINGSTSSLMEVWYRQGTYLGYTTSNAGWTLLGSYNVTAAGAGLPTRLPVGGLVIPAGQTYGIFVTYVSGSITYTNGTGSNQVYTDANLTLTTGAGGGYFSVTNTPRVWNGNLYYTVGSSSSSCFSDKVPLTVNVIGFPTIDAGVSQITSPGSTVPSGTTVDIDVELTNFGLNNLQTVDIVWALNNVVQDTIHWTGNLPYQHSDTVTLTTTSFNGGVYSLKSWTRIPNNIADTINTNDTTMITFNSCLSGTYTIGNPANGTFDFPSFSSAVTALNLAGVCGHVLFNVDTGSYNEQITLISVPGSGPNATITFQSATLDSNDVTLKFSATSTTDNFVVYLNGADYITFRKMTIQALNSTYGTVIQIANGANRNLFENNKLLSLGTSSNNRVVYDYTTLNNYNTYRGNYMYGGYYTMYTYGIGTTSWQKGTVIEDNIITDFYMYGILAYYHDSIQIKGNYVTNGASANTYYYAIYPMYINNGYRIVDNEVVLNVSPTSANYSYGLRDYYGNYYSYNANPTAFGLVANNMVTINGGSSGHYGLYAYYSNGTKYYYNTINITNGNTSAYCLYQYNTTTNTQGQHFLNNNFVNQSTGFAAYYGTPASIVTCDNNNYYSNGTNLAYWNGNITSLAALQTANATFNINSLNVMPVFFSNNNLRLMTTSLSAYGIPVSDVLKDIDGELRSTMATTIGADEVPLLPYDLGVSKVFGIADSTFEAYTYPLSAQVKNYGTSTVYSYTVQYTINNGTPVNTIINDSIVPGQVDTVSLGNIISPAGMSVICAKSVYTADSNAFNDSYCKNFFGVPTKDAEVKEIIEIPFYCGITYDTIKVKIVNLGIDSINASNQTVPTTVSYKVNNLPTVTETFTTQVAPTDSVVYAFSNLAYLGTNNYVDSIYNVKAWIDFTGDNVDVNDTAYFEFEALHQPVPPTVTSPINVPYGTSATLTAISSDNVIWYRYDTATVVLDTGATYITPYLYATDSFYVVAQGGGSGGNTIIGTGTDVSQPLPLNMYYGHTYSQTIYTVADFNGSFGKITKVAWYYNGNSAQGPDDIDIYMGVSSQNTFSSTTSWIPYNQLTNVYHGTLSVPATAGWVEFTLTTPFIYDGNSNLVVGFHEYTYGYHNSADDFYCTAVTGNRSIYYYSDATNPSPSAPPTAMGTPAFIPNVKFEILPSGCESQREMVKVIIGSQPANDVGPFTLHAPTSSIYMSNSEPVKVMVRNFGTAAQSNIPVGYKFNNGGVVWDTVPGPIPAGDSTLFTFGSTVNMSNIGPYNIKVFTAHPGDANVLNDTLNKTVTNLNANYCACAATSGSYEDLTGVSVGLWSYSNSPTGAMYTDYTSVSPTAIVSPGSTYNVSISSGFPPGYSYQYTCYANMFIDFNRDGDFDDAGELAFGGTTQSSAVLNGSITIPPTAGTGATRMRIVLRESGTQANTGPCGTFTWGEAEDYNILLQPQIPNDAGVELFLTPGTVATTTSVPLNIRIRNYGSDTITSVDLRYTINGSTPATSFTYNAFPIAPLDSVNINLGNITISQGANIIKAYTVLAGDTNFLNDTLVKTIYLPATVSINYFDDFEGTNLWMPDTIANQWERGIPTASTINTAYSPVNVWATQLDTFYNNNSGDYLYSPVLTIPSYADSAMLKFYHYYNLQSGTTGDGAYIQVNVNNTAWATMGYISDPDASGWYTTNVGGTHMWNGTSTGWVPASYWMDFQDPGSQYYGATSVQFRFILYSNTTTNNFDGWAIDNFEVTLPSMPNDAGVTAVTSPVTSTQVGSVVTPTVTVKNFGTQPITSVNVAYRLNNTGTWTQETFIPTAPIAPGATSNFTFATAYTGPANTYQFCAKTILTGDFYTANDEFCTAFTTTPAPLDAGIKLISKPKDTTKLSTPAVVEVVLINHGGQTITSMNVEYKLAAAATWTSEPWTGSLAPGDSVHYVFTTTYGSPVSVYTLSARTQLTTDANPLNDMVTKSLLGINDIGIDNPETGFLVGQNEPNPATGVVNIPVEIPNTGTINFEVMNSLGQIIHSETKSMVAGNGNIKFDTEKLANGVYYFTVEYNATKVTKKMIVTK